MTLDVSIPKVLPPSPSGLRGKAIRGVHWTALSQLSRQGMSLVATAVLARLLAPGDYGLMGMAVIVTGFASVYRDMGTSSAVVQRPEMPLRMLSSIFWMNMVIGLIIMGLIIAFAPLAGWFFKEPRVMVLLGALGPTFVLSNLSAIHQSLLQREMRFGSLATVEILTACFSYTMAIGAAIYGLGVWSLVLQLYCQQITQGLLLWRAESWRPQRTCSWADLRSISNFSLNLTAFSTINYWARNLDNTLIGRYLGSFSLGCYGMAYQLMRYPQILASGMFARVLFPLLSKISDNQAFLKTYLKIAGFITLITCPIYFGMLVLARPLVVTVFTNHWEQVILPLMVLSLVGMNQSVATMTGNIYMAKGRTDLMFRVGFASTIIYITGIIAGLHWGIVGVAIGYAIADLVATPLDYYFAFRLIQAPMWKVWGAMARPFLCGMIMALVLAISSPCVLTRFGKISGLFAVIGLGGTVYLCALWLFNRKQLLECWSLVRNRK